MSDCIKVTFLGDVMCDYEMSQGLERYYDPETQSYDFQSVFAPMKSYLAKSDSVFANLETPLSEEKDNLTCRQYEFCSHISFARALKEAGVHCVGAANNHCLDRGYPGLLHTIQCLDKLGLRYSGIYDTEKEIAPTILDVRGCRIGFLSYTYGTNAFSNHQYLSFRERRAVNLLQEQEEDRFLVRSPYKWMQEHKETAIAKIYFGIRNHISKKPIYERRNLDFYRRRLISQDLHALKKAKVDKIFFYLHIGGQYNQEPIPYTRKMIAHLMREGCDVIIGNHEHVIHGYVQDASKKRFGTYALGNFLGSAGTLHPPCDRCCDFSILLNAYIDSEDKEIRGYTYSVTKTVYNEKTQKFEVHPAFELAQSLSGREREELTHGALQAAFLFSGKREKELLEEFEI